MTPPIRYHAGKFPPKDIDWARLVPLIGSAHAAVARLDGTLNAVPNPNVLLSPLTTQEATLSSKIEGTQATMGEVLEFEAGDESLFPPEKAADILEILNYRQALNEAAAALSRLAGFRDGLSGRPTPFCCKASAAIIKLRASIAGQSIGLASSIPP